MAKIDINKLSVSTDGRPIIVAAIATAGTLIHTATTGDVQMILLASNQTATAEELVLEWGATGAVNFMYFQMPAFQTLLIVNGWYLTNNATINAFAKVANSIHIVGHELVSA